MTWPLTWLRMFCVTRVWRRRSRRRALSLRRYEVCIRWELTARLAQWRSVALALSRGVEKAAEYQELAARQRTTSACARWRSTAQALVRTRVVAPQAWARRASLGCLACLTKMAADKRVARQCLALGLVVRKGVAVRLWAARARQLLQLSRSTELVARLRWRCETMGAVQALRVAQQRSEQETRRAIAASRTRSLGNAVRGWRATTADRARQARAIKEAVRSLNRLRCSNAWRAAREHCAERLQARALRARASQAARRGAMGAALIGWRRVAWEWWAAPAATAPWHYTRAAGNRCWRVWHAARRRGILARSVERSWSSTRLSGRRCGRAATHLVAAAHDAATARLWRWRRWRLEAMAQTAVRVTRSWVRLHRMRVGLRAWRARRAEEEAYQRTLERVAAWWRPRALRRAVRGWERWRQAAALRVRTTTRRALHAWAAERRAAHHGAEWRSLHRRIVLRRGLHVLRSHRHARRSALLSELGLLRALGLSLKREVRLREVLVADWEAKQHDGTELP